MNRRLSVILAVFNGMPYLPGAVESILSQTFKDFTLIVVDDGSTDKSVAYLQSLNDKRIVLIRQANAGQAAARNVALRLCQTEYAAVIDQDDIALPIRFARQVEFLDAHAEVVAVGTQIRFIVGDTLQNTFPVPTNHDDIEKRLLQGKAGVCHPSLMFRAAPAIATGGYPEGVMGEDIDFCLRLCDRMQIANLDEVLLHYRLHTSQSSVTKNGEMIRANHYAAYRAVCRRNGYPISALDAFVQNASWVDRWRWSIEAQMLFFYRTGRIRLATGHPIDGCTRLALSGLCHPLSAIRRVMQTLKQRIFKTMERSGGALQEEVTR